MRSGPERRPATELHKHTGELVGMRAKLFSSTLPRAYEVHEQAGKLLCERAKHARCVHGLADVGLRAEVRYRA